MDSNTQNTQPEKKQSFWAKLFGGGKKQDAIPPTPPVDPAVNTPAPSEPTTPATDFSANSSFGADTSSTPAVDAAPEPEPAPFMPEPSAPAVDEQPLPPINGPEDAAMPAAPAEEVPEADVSKVDEALNSLPPLPVAPDEPSAAPAGEIPQPPVDPMVNPVNPTSEASTEEQTPTINP